MVRLAVLSLLGLKALRIWDMTVPADDTVNVASREVEAEHAELLGRSNRIGDI
jgi:hypothetical protein